jgi:colanic acid biosynthesis protein WcaH
MTAYHRHVSRLSALFIASAAFAAAEAAASTKPKYASTMGDGLPVAGKFLSSNLYDEVMHNLPVPTADVLVLSSDLGRTLLFNRTNRPVRNIYYSIGGRVFKNEHLAATAIRKLNQELPSLGAVVSAEDLVLGGVMEEIFSDSAFDDTNSHCVNTVFGIVLSGEGGVEEALVKAKHDSQSTRGSWFSVDDPQLHPYVKQKLNLLLRLPALADKACQGYGESEAGCTTHSYAQGYQIGGCVWSAQGPCIAAASAPISTCAMSRAAGGTQPRPSSYIAILLLLLPGTLLLRVIHNNPFRLPAGPIVR